MGVAGVAAEVRNAVRAFETSTSLPYDEVPTEMCRPMVGTRSINLADWSLLVKDSTLRRIAVEERRRIDDLANQRSIKEVGSHIDAMGLSDAVRGVDSAGVTRFDPVSMVSWREKQALGRLKTEGFERFKEYFTTKEGLTRLDVAGAEGIGDGGLSALAAQCRGLQHLNISGAHQVTDVAIRSLAVNCTGLTRLHLHGCHGINGPGLAPLGECCLKLVDLDLSGCKKIGDWVLTRIFRECHELETVSLARCPRAGDEALKELGMGCRKLIRLDLRDCTLISDTGLLEVARRCSALVKLDLSRSELPSNIGDVTLLALGEGCPGLQRLEAKGCGGVTDVGLTWMSDGCPKLEYLDITDCVQITNAGVISLSERCPLLAHLGMAGLKYVTDNGVAKLTAGCSKLRYLNLSGLVFLSDGKQRDFALSGIQALSRGCSELEVLVLDQCFQIAKASLRAIANGLQSLRRLSMASCPSLTVEGMSTVAKGCASLTDLNLSNCGSAVTNGAVSAFARGCKGLQRLALRRIVGTPSPLGAPGILAVCVHCRELKSLDLEEVPGLDDSALVGFHEHRMEKLKRVNLRNCPRITGMGVQWLADGCPVLCSLNLKGTRATLTALDVLKERYPYCYVKVEVRFFGLSPLTKTKQRIAMNRHALLHKSAKRVQHAFRTKIARKEVFVHRRRRVMKTLAGMLSRVWRKKQDRAHLQEFSLLISREAGCAVVIQTIWRKVLARILVDRLRRERYQRELPRRAIYIQRSYRGVCGRRKVDRRRVEVCKIQERQAEATLSIQQIFRMHRAKVECQKRCEAKERLLRKRDNAARMLGMKWRSYRAQQELEFLRRLCIKGKVKQEMAGTAIQKAFRVMRCRRRLEQKRHERACKHASVAVIQRHYRGSCARALYAVLFARREGERQTAAAIRLQCWRRLTASRALITILAKSRQLQQVHEQNGARTIQQFYRRYKIKMERLAANMDHEDEVLAMAKLEIWAATRIQALARGAKGRAKATARRLEHMGRWKEMFDEERGASFYYSQVSGEIRWRRPQEVLELLPRPPCGDCGYFEAFSECADCGEFFCSACFQKVHGGGKRLYHEFRALYDYYGRRVDYGDGEFPSCWPTEIAQDDENGWRRRVSPEGGASEEVGDWIQYTDDTGGSHSGEDLYYNTATGRVTGESTYQPTPIGWDWSGADAVSYQTPETVSFKEEDSEWRYPEDGLQLQTDPAFAWENHGNTGTATHQHYTESNESQALLEERVQRGDGGALIKVEEGLSEHSPRETRPDTSNKSTPLWTSKYNSRRATS
ncbi:unnamed protein product [Ascophyllum nodosum]